MANESRLFVAAEAADLSARDGANGAPLANLSYARMPTPRRTTPRRATTAKKLLTESLAGIGPAALAHAAGVSVERLEHWSTSAYRMTTAERAAVAVAVIAMAPQSS